MSLKQQFLDANRHWLFGRLLPNKFLANLEGHLEAVAPGLETTLACYFQFTADERASNGS